MYCRRIVQTALLMWMTSGVVVRADNFAATVIDAGFCDNDPDYRPATGQFVNNSAYNDPNRALGAPIGGGTSTQNSAKVVSLGSFGGQIILAFDHDVLDEPANPFGVDAIVFSNTFWPSGDPNLHATETAHIEIMPELNGNGIPGDDPNEQWYLIPGPNLASGSWRTKSWPDANFPPAWYPSISSFPNRPASYQTGAYELDLYYQIVAGYVGVVINPSLLDGDPNTDDVEGIWGYAEYTPTLKHGDRNGDNTVGGFGDDANIPADIFYTTPDDPFKVGVTTGSGGGDGFDIAWAVDPNNAWQPANLTAFRYIRITTAAEKFFPAIGEMSPEIGAVADVRPLGDLDADLDVDLDDYAAFVDAWGTDPCQPNWSSAADLDVDEDYDVDLADYGLWLRGFQLYSELAEPNEPNGELQITAEIVEGDFESGEGYVVIKISAQHTGSNGGDRWFNGLRAVAANGGGVWVDPSDIDVIEIVQSTGTLVPGNPPDADQINTESDANAAQDNWLTYGPNDAVEYAKNRDTWIYDAFANFLDAPGPDDPNGWTFTATQSPNTVGDTVELMQLVIRKKAGYDGTPARITLGGQWGLVGEAPNPSFLGVIIADDPNVEGDLKTGVITVQPLRTLNLESGPEDYGYVEISPNVPAGPPYMYPVGTSLTLTAVPYPDHGFHSWRIYDPNYPGDANYETLDTNMVLHLTMDTDWEIKAVFQCSSGTEMLLPILMIPGMVMLCRRR